MRYAVRTLIKTPGFTLAIIISIALGIAANTTVFSIAEGLLWGVLPIRDSQSLVSFPDGGKTFSSPDYVDYRDQTVDVFEGGVCAYFAFVPASIGGTGEPERVWGQAVSGNYFSVVGVTPALDRGILPEEDKAVGRDHVVVLSYSLWRRRFGSDAGIVGLARDSKSRKLDEEPTDCAYLFLEAAPQKVMSFYGISMVVKTSVNPRPLMRPVWAQVNALDPSMAIFNAAL
ncbi:MAG TPA: ABC transporter permease [Terriglobia bacterium]|nr:ABC transporter permease [Terriglobia bacterium]